MDSAPFSALYFPLPPVASLFPPHFTSVELTLQATHQKPIAFFQWAPSRSGRGGRGSRGSWAVTSPGGRGGREEGMTPNPLRGMRTPRVSSRVAPAPERSGGSRTRGRHPSEGGRTTHPRNLKGVAASPHSLPWHQVQVPQGPKVSERSELAPMGRGGSVTGEKGQRPAAGPSCASLLHSAPPAIHYAKPGTHLAVSHAPPRPTRRTLPPPL